MAKFAVALLALALFGSAVSTSISPALQTLMSADPAATLPNLIITLKEGTSVVRNQVKTQNFANRLDRASFLTTGLQTHVAHSQKNVLSFLNKANAVNSLVIKSFWVSNTIFVSGASAEIVQGLAAFPEIAEIRQEKILHILDPIPANGGKIGIFEPIGPLVEWGVNDIEAPAAWDLGFSGEGILVNTIDTGARHTHNALKDNYIGTENNGWYDPYANTAAPNDGNGHGTHTTATIAGVLGYGVAPKAKWSACKGCSTSSCTEVALIGCGQWVVCPNGAAPCRNVPHLSSNSWGGGRGDTFYNEVIANWHAAGITPIFANGNAGPACDTANSPADQNVIGVGSTNNVRALSLFSSKGPALDGGIKPDISAPGTDVKSAWHTSDVATNTISGTSMACPHVAGVVALVKGANPDPNNDLTYDQVKDILFKTVDTNVTPTTRNCGGIDTRIFPNNSFGWGKVNARKAVIRASTGAF